MNYSGIKNMAELDSARAKLSAELAGRKRDIIRSVDTARQTYTPTAIVAEGLRRASATIPVDRIVLNLIRRLRKKSCRDRA